MKASIKIKNFLGRWVKIVLRNGMKLTVKIKSVIDDLYGHAIVSYEIVGSREARQIAKSEIIDVYA